MFRSNNRSKCRDVSECVTVTIKTRHRLDNVLRMVRSIRQLHPGIAFVVADEINPDYIKNSPKEWLDLVSDLKSKITYFQTRQSMGLGRTLSTRIANTPYVLITDDDFVITHNTDLNKLLGVLQQTDVAIVGGRVDQNPFDGIFRVKGPTGLQTLPEVTIYPNVFYEALPCFNDCYVGDIVKNFFMADRQELVNSGGWDGSQLFFEHTDFFLLMRKRNVKVAFCTGVTVVHAARVGNRFVDRGPWVKKGKEYVFKKWNITQYRKTGKADSYFSDT